MNKSLRKNIFSPPFLVFEKMLCKTPHVRVFAVTHPGLKATENIDSIVDKMCGPSSPSLMDNHTHCESSAPDAWNTLSSDLRRSCVSLNCFKCSLKTFLHSL